MGQQHDTTSGTLTTLLAGAVIGAAGLAWWLLNEADRRRRLGNEKAMPVIPIISVSARPPMSCDATGDKANHPKISQPATNG